ncbi:unnamed protein product [Cladocopium goreaui]|uniref:Pentatricopeptide repeat-containing protein GUN1, chloroplastic (Pentatricopeptide repeat-containing protein At2g31400) (Protein GENOMES UNCOUPLED 1) n=1 Tax=Cladocopium goreaui TaxID=2562237 RepID=A0A9P1FZN4_9DINO|nr:unnamed protein product [Cladocopium goreaui]
MLSLQIFNKLQHTHVRSDVITLTSAINACDKGNSWQLAIHSFFWWRDFVVPNAITCTTLMSALNTKAEWQQCLCLFQFCLAARFQADAILFSAAINACAEGSQWQEAFRILNSMKPWSFLPDSIMMNAAISACEKAEEWQWALHLLDSFAMLALLPCVVSFAAAASACEKAAQWQFALELLKEAKQAKSQTRIDVIMYNAAISACGRCNQWLYALNLLADMEAVKVLPSSVTMNACITAAPNYQEAIDLLGSIESRSLEADVIGYNAAITACEKDYQWPTALLLLGHLVHRTLEATVVTWTSACAACAASGIWQHALTVQAVQDLNELTFDAAIRSCAVAQKLTLRRS